MGKEKALLYNRMPTYKYIRNESVRKIIILQSPLLQGIQARISRDPKTIR